MWGLSRGGGLALIPNWAYLSPCPTLSVSQCYASILPIKLLTFALLFVPVKKVGRGRKQQLCPIPTCRLHQRAVSLALIHSRPSPPDGDHPPGFPPPLNCAPCIMQQHAAQRCRIRNRGPHFSEDTTPSYSAAPPLLPQPPGLRGGYTSLSPGSCRSRNSRGR